MILSGKTNISFSFRTFGLVSFWKAKELEVRSVILDYTFNISPNTSGIFMFAAIVLQEEISNSVTETFKN